MYNNNNNNHNVIKTTTTTTTASEIMNLEGRLEDRLIQKLTFQQRSEMEATKTTFTRLFV